MLSCCHQRIKLKDETDFELLHFLNLADYLKLLFPLMHRYPFHISLMLSFNFSRVNISMGPLEERMMLSGMHTVADIFCCCCGQNVGWKYISLTSRFFGSGFLFLTLFLSLFGRNQRMRKNRNIKKANLFWKGNQLLL